MWSEKPFHLLIRSRSSSSSIRLFTFSAFVCPDKGI